VARASVVSSPAGLDSPLPTAASRELGGTARPASRALQLLLAACVLLLAASAATSNYAAFVSGQAAPLALPAGRASRAVNAVNATLRQRMVADLYIDCTPTPCVATPAGKALLVPPTTYSNDPTITGTMPPQIATLTAVTELWVYNNDEMSGTLPTQLGLMTLVEDARLYKNAKLSGTIPPQLASMTSVTRLYVECEEEVFVYDLCV
jgi:hypothetical protein